MCSGSRWGDPVQVNCEITTKERLKQLDSFEDFYDPESPYYGTKARVRFLVQHGTDVEPAREQAAREKKASAARGVKTSKPHKKALPIAIINGEKIYGK